MATPTDRMSAAADAEHKSITTLPTTAMGFTTIQSFEALQRAAKLLAASTIVPKAYQGIEGLPNCVVALNMANRIGTDPLMVMQNLYTVNGRPSWSGQFVIACFNTCGRFDPIEYEWSGVPEKAPKTPAEIPDDWSCTAVSKNLATGKVIRGPTISIRMAKQEGWFSKKDSKWQTIPELMLMYRAGAWLQRTHAAEISMGLRTMEEEQDVIEARQTGHGSYDATPSTATTRLAEAAAKRAAPREPIDGEVVPPTAQTEPAAASTGAKADDATPTQGEILAKIIRAETLEAVEQHLEMAKAFLSDNDYAAVVTMSESKKKQLGGNVAAADPAPAEETPAADVKPAEKVTKKTTKAKGGALFGED